jgi:tetratricopeptide (TPR) repeat protein
VLGDSPFTFWQILKTNLGAQKNILRHFPKYIPLLTGFTSVVPVILIGIRWSSSVGDISYMAQIAAKWMFRIVHAALLAACVVVAFDPRFSPRQLGLGFAFLPYYFLGALAAGYFAGYFLTIGQMPVRVRRHLTSGERFGRFTAVWLTRAATVVVFAALAVRNYPVIRVANGPLLRETAVNILAAAPPAGGLLLGDGAHAAILGVVEAHLQATGATEKFVPVRTDMLRWSSYQKALENRAGGRWPADAASMDPLQLMRDTALQELMLRAALSNSVTYVHPSFGYYFERFRVEPRGPVWLLTPFEANAPVSEPLSTNVMAYNRNYWRDVAPSLAPLVQHRARGNPTLQLLANYYSLLLNTWAVELQRNDRAGEAKQLFAVAAQLNPENISAIINRKFNESLLAGTIATVEFDKPMEMLFSKFGNNWDAALGLCGPIDEPASAFNLAQTLARFGNFRQAAALLERIVELQPNLPGPRFMLTDALLQAGLHENALGSAAQIRERLRPLTHAQEAELVRVEAWSFFRRQDFATAESLLEGAAKSYPELDGPLEALSQIHLLAGHFTNAIDALDRQLQRAPNNARALLNRGAIAIQIGQYSNAIQSLDHLLTLTPSNPPALLNRAIANLKTTNLDAAERDYKSLKIMMPKLPSVYFGLGEVAFQRNQKDIATGHYREYLKLASTNSDERALVTERLSQLQKP